jgi:hypothetical protein
MSDAIAPRELARTEPDLRVASSARERWADAEAETRLGVLKELALALRGVAGDWCDDWGRAQGASEDGTLRAAMWMQGPVSLAASLLRSKAALRAPPAQKKRRDWPAPRAHVKSEPRLLSRAHGATDAFVQAARAETEAGLPLTLPGPERVQLPVSASNPFVLPEPLLIRALLRCGASDLDQTLPPWLHTLTEPIRAQGILGVTHSEVDPALRAWVVVLVPGPYSARDLAFHAQNLASELARAVCLGTCGPLVLVMHERWLQRDAFVAMLDAELRSERITKMVEQSAPFAGAAEFEGLSKLVSLPGAPFGVLPDVTADSLSVGLFSRLPPGLFAQVSLSPSTEQGGYKTQGHYADAAPFLSSAQAFVAARAQEITGLSLLVHDATSDLLPTQVLSAAAGMGVPLVGYNTMPSLTRLALGGPAAAMASAEDGRVAVAQSAFRPLFAKAWPRQAGFSVQSARALFESTMSLVLA